MTSDDKQKHESSVCAQAINYIAHTYFVISQHTIISTIVLTQYTNDTLQLTVVVHPSFAPAIKIFPNCLAWCSTHRVKVLSQSFRLQSNGCQDDAWVQVAHHQAAWSTWQRVHAVDIVELIDVVQHVVSRQYSYSEVDQNIAVTNNSIMLSNSEYAITITVFGSITENLSTRRTFPCLKRLKWSSSPR